MDNQDGSYTIVSSMQEKDSIKIIRPHIKFGNRRLFYGKGTDLIKKDGACLGGMFK